MNGPLMNTIKSFWTPEASTDPEFRRLVRQDKAIFLIAVAAIIVTVAGSITVAIGLGDLANHV